MLERNSIKAQMGGECSSGDLLTMCTLKLYNVHINDQHNLSRAAQIIGCFLGIK